MSAAVLFRDRWSASAHLVSLDPCRPGKWRASRFDAYGAAGHTDAEDRESAIRSAVAHGADPSTAQAVTSESVASAVEALGLDVFSAPCEQWTGAQ